MSEETKQKLSKANKGRTFPPRSKEWCENISKAKSGVSSPLKGIKSGPMSDEAKNNMSIANKGRIFSKEHKRNLSIALKKYWNK